MLISQVYSELLSVSHTISPGTTIGSLYSSLHIIQLQLIFTPLLTQPHTTNELEAKVRFQGMPHTHILSWTCTAAPETCMFFIHPVLLVRRKRICLLHMSVQTLAERLFLLLI